MFLGIGAYWLLVDFPDKAHTSWKFLTQREALFIIKRVDADRGDAKPEPWSTAKFFKGGADIKVWGYAMVSTAQRLAGTVLTSSDLLQHHNSLIRSRILPAHYSADKHGLQHRRSSVSCCTSLRIRWHRNVRSRLRRRQVPHPRPNHRLQHASLSDRSAAHGLPQERGCPVLWCFPHNRRCQQQRPSDHVVPGKQHPRAVEASLLLGHARRHGWCWWYRWRSRLQRTGYVNSR
jgi:hypothetical protein